MVCAGSPFRNVTGHIEQSVLIGFKRSHLDCIHGSVINVITAQGFEVGKEATLVVTCVGTSPRIHRKIKASACSIFPFGLKRQAVVVDIGHALGTQLSLIHISEPYTESTCLYP